MARKYRVFIKNLPFLVQLESIDNINLFKDSYDYDYLLSLIKDLSKKYSFNIYAYVLLQNSIYFLGTPKEMDSLSKFMQSLARSYSRYYNNKYKRKGTLWANRYKASLVEEELYLLDTMIFVESLPKDAILYPYSSLKVHAFNKDSDFLVEHKIYKELGNNNTDRAHKYLAIFNNRLNNISQFDYIRQSLQKQLTIGSLNFIKKIEDTIGKTIRSKKRGRPPKKNKKDEKMYSKLTPLDKVKHANLKLKEIENLNFTKDLNFAPIAAKELELLSKQFPVVFSGAKEPAMIVLLSLGNGNLAITKEGKWLGNYIPSYIRKYPFDLAIVNNETKEKVVLIDENSTLLSETEGNALFTKDGEATDILKHAVNFLTAYDKEIMLTNKIAKEINDSGILVDREITVGNGDEKKVLVKGFKVIDREKLNSLSDDILASWVRRGIINIIEAHLKSLNNIENLFKLMTQKEQ